MKPPSTSIFRIANRANVFLSKSFKPPKRKLRIRSKRPVFESRRVNHYQSGRTFDLIVNGLVDAKSRRPLPYLQVMPVGKTEPLNVQWLGAFNHALEEPTIRIKFNDYIDPVEVTPERIRVEPAVEKMKLLASDDEIEITGDFDLKQRYKVTISPELKGDRGYGLACRITLGRDVSTRKKPASSFQPRRYLHARARNCALHFFQVNTPQVTWKLARIPAEKLSAVSARVKEFEKDATDPVTGKAITDPRTGFAKQFQTELLVDAFQLPVSASGTFRSHERRYRNATRSSLQLRQGTKHLPARIFSKRAQRSLTAGSLGIAPSFA